MSPETDAHSTLSSAHSKSLADIFIAYGDSIIASDDAAVTAAPALAYAKRGIPVFPCRRDKSPLTKGGFKDATCDADQIRKWWTKWPDALIGMPTGAASGVDILDLDVKNGKDGFAKVPNWRDLSPTVSRTPSGGAHLWFESRGTVPSTVDKIAVGVDTRGTGGYVVVPPSPGYRFEQSSAYAKLPPFPADLQAKISRAKDQPRVLNNMPPADPGEIAAALAVIPSDSYQVWFEVGCAIHRELGEDGFDLFDAWSAKSEKYNERECRRKWQECAKVAGYTTGTIFHHANEASPGWWEAAAWKKFCKGSAA